MTPDTFHLFGRLPPELRHLIWIEFLAEQLGGRMYRLTLTPPTNEHNGMRYLLNLPPPITAEDQLFNGTPFALNNPTKPSRTLSAVCREARQIVCGFLPDTLEFGYNYEDLSGTPKSHYRNNIPCHARAVLRYNATSDIIYFEEDIVGVDHLLEGSKNRGNGGAIRGLKHLGICSDALAAEDLFTEHNYCPAGCEGLERIACSQHDKFPQFLRLFPDVSHIYIVEKPWSNRITLDGCFCGFSGSSDEPEVVHASMHQWPRIRGPQPRDY